MTRSVTAHGRGDGAIRATHQKTLELVREPAIGPRATCVVAVGVEVDERALARLGGEAELTIAVGAQSESVRGLVNPSYRAGARLVVRRSRALTPDAILIGADKSAADLDRSLVAALRDPGAEVRITLRSLPTAGGVLVVAGPAAWGGQLSPDEAAAADDVVRAPLSEAATARALERLARGERLAVVGEGSAQLVAAAVDRGHVVLPAAGQAPIAAALAVAGVDARRVVVDRTGAPGTDALLASGACLVLADTSLAEARSRLAAAAGLRGVVGVHVGSRREQWLRWPDEAEAAAALGGRTPAVAAVGSPAGGLGDALEELALELLRRGTGPRRVVELVRRLTGLPRRAVYDAVVALADADEARRDSE